MLKIFLQKMINSNKRRGFTKEAGQHFTRSFEELDTEIRQVLGLPKEGPYIKGDKPKFRPEYPYEKDIMSIIKKYNPVDPFGSYSSYIRTPDTMSSSFVSIITSETTVPTPEPIPTPEPTLSVTLYDMVSNTVDKAIYQQVDEKALRYDTAYVELSKAVENAMDVPVEVIKEDINHLFFNAYRRFEYIIEEKERIAAQIAWEKRMRKKLKRTLRRQINFKGYETPPTPKSQISSHESYKRPPPSPCKCHPQFHYNRYPKDRFGIYYPQEESLKYDGHNVTTTPPISVASAEEVNKKADTKSIVSGRSAISAPSIKSTISHKTAEYAKSDTTEEGSL